MRALVLKNFGDLAVDEIGTPEPGPGEVLVRTLHTGICGSDLHGYTGASGRRVPGQIMGHETVGRIAAVGQGVDLDRDSLVTVNPVVGCAECASCRQGVEQYCATKRVIGVDPSRPAAFAEYFVAPASNAIVLSETMPEEYGALIEPLAVGYHAAARGSLGENDTVLVLGGGPIGQAVVLGARRLGVQRIVVSEPAPGRRRICEELGAGTLDPTEVSVHEEVPALFGTPATVAVDAVGNQATVADALRCTPLGGRIVLVGMAAPRAELDMFAISTGERQLLGSFSYSSAEFADVAAWVSTAPDILGRLIERTVPLDEAACAFAALSGENEMPGKVLVRF